MAWIDPSRRVDTMSTGSPVAIVADAVPTWAAWVTVTVLAIQMATGTFSARYMRIWYRDRLLRAVLAVLAGTLTFAFSLIRQVGSKQVPNIGVSVAGFLLVLSLVLFLLFFDRFIHRLRPVAVADLVGQMALRVIASVTQAAEIDTSAAEIAAGDPVLMVTSGRAGSIQAIHVPGLVTWASRHNHLLAMQAAVGDFVTTGQHLIAVFGDGAAPVKASRLQAMVALGAERTVAQDPAFAIRIMADIAVKALSAAINDPTTAVQALDHLGNVLRLLGATQLHGPLTFRDTKGTPRLLMPGRTWTDYLTLAVTEIREYGSTSIQVMRRLRAVLEDLQESVRPEHRPAVAAEIAKLDATTATGFAGSVDENQARARDRQGIGGPAASEMNSPAASN